MTIHELKQHPGIRLIRGAEAAALLHSAVEQRAVLRTEVTNARGEDAGERQDDVTSPGVCVLTAAAIGEEIFEARPAENARGVVLPPVAASVDVTLVLRGASCGFHATVTEVDDQFCWIRLSVPSVIFLVDRRRSSRRALRRSARVCLSAVNGTWTCAGSLLNVSADGLACRVSRFDVPHHAEGGKVFADFDLEDHFAFRLDAQVAAITPAADENFLVVNLAFPEGADASPERQRLRAALTCDASLGTPEGKAS
ncbi:MAG: PilZ domain-containing protein [Phycisphaerae bacterium]|nr:PilZ domain-containing protein [Phycisphaerae bacterium]